MATYDNLPVYKKIYDLLLQLFRLGQNMERDYLVNRLYKYVVKK